MSAVTVPEAIVRAVAELSAAGHSRDFNRDADARLALYDAIIAYAASERADGRAEGLAGVDAAIEALILAAAAALQGEPS